MNNDVRFDFITNTIIVSKGYYGEACKPGTKENMELLQFQKDYPNMRITLRSIRTGRRKPETKGLTYKYMRRFIAVMDSQNLVTFDKVLLHYELHEENNTAVYHHVKEWFLRTYPHHKDMIVDAEPQAIGRTEVEDTLRISA